jgi:hypothetical protein
MNQPKGYESLGKKNNGVISRVSSHSSFNASASWDINLLHVQRQVDAIYTHLEPEYRLLYIS